MNSFKPRLLSFLLPMIAVAAIAQQPSGPSAPAIAFEKNAVVVTGVTLKGQAVLFGEGAGARRGRRRHPGAPVPGADG